MNNICFNVEAGQSKPEGLNEQTHLSLYSQIGQKNLVQKLILTNCRSCQPIQEKCMIGQQNRGESDAARIYK